VGNCFAVGTRVAEPTPDAEARLIRLESIEERVGSALTPGDFKKFLITPHPLLRGHQPLDLLWSAYSFEDLESFVESAKSGDMG